MSSYSYPLNEEPSTSKPSSLTTVKIEKKDSNDIRTSNTLKAFVTKVLNVGIVCGILYLMQFFNALTMDQLDAILSLYPRHWRSLLHIFTCPLVHDSYTHLNSIIIFFAICMFFVLLRGTCRFWYISVVVVVLGNFLSWIFGKGRMNGVSGWTFGLLGYIYFSVITDIGYPIKCSIHGVKALVIAVLVSVALGCLLHHGIIPSHTACWQYNVSGLISGIFAAYLFTSTSLAVSLGAIPQERYDLATSTPTAQTNHSLTNSASGSRDVDESDEESGEKEKKRVLVGKNLIKFNDLRKPLV